MNRTLAALAVVLMTARAAYAVPAPGFSIAEVLNGPVKRINGLKDLKGKVVFLDFWATWCVPCVASMPHMNALHEGLKGEPVVFIAITDESADTIQPFLKTHEIRSWIGIDKKKSSFRAYKVEGRPDGYLIGRDGSLLARIFPAHLTEKNIRDAIAGKFEPRPVQWPEAKTGAKSPAKEKPIFEISVSSASGKRSMSGGWDKLEMQSIPFEHALAFLWGVEADQLMVDTRPVSAFNAFVRTPPRFIDHGKEALKIAVKTAFSINVTPENRETDVFVLALSTAAGAPRPMPGEPGALGGLASCGGGHLIGTADMPQIARALWMNLHKPVVDETGLGGEYEMDFIWTDGNMDELEALLAKQGLRLVPAIRTIEFLRVTAQEPPEYKH